MSALHVRSRILPQEPLHNTYPTVGTRHNVGEGLALPELDMTDRVFVNGYILMEMV